MQIEIKDELVKELDKLDIFRIPAGKQHVQKLTREELVEDAVQEYLRQIQSDDLIAAEHDRQEADALDNSGGGCNG